MGREVRRVPADWQHSKDDNGQPIPLRCGDFEAIATAWDAGRAQWDAGMIASHDSRPGASASRPRDRFTRARDYEEHAGPRPRVESYMPGWPAAQRTHWQMYETTTAGTPISPPCASARELASWLADHHVSAGPGFTATASEWLAMITGSGHSALFIMRKGCPVSALAKR